MWGTDFIAESNIVDRHIRSLRIKLQNDYRQPRFIATVPGRGYRFVPTFSNQGWTTGPAGATRGRVGTPRAADPGLAAQDRATTMTGRHDATTPGSDTAMGRQRLSPAHRLAGSLPSGSSTIPLLASHDTGPIRSEWPRPALVDTGDGITRPEDDVSS